MFYEIVRTLLYILVLSNCLNFSYSDSIEDDPGLRQFIGTLERYQNEQIDLVFLLDESGSIGAAVFPQELLFTELVARIISISSTTHRATVITFSSGHIVRFNYIENSAGNNMCTFVPDIWRIDYKGGGTNTADALIVAKTILQKGRSSSKKVIILISDGQSNDNAATVRAAQDLKNSHHIIFAVGVAEVNEQELLSVATGKEYIYILRNFQYIQKINEKLKTDTKETSWDLINNSSLCDNFCTEHKDCCDINAGCFCGTKGGKYECACNAGYSGSGYKQTCSPCPKGTFSFRSTKQQCESCPKHSTTQFEGNTKKEDCFCLPGYEGDPANDIPCRAVECAKLLSPEGGTVLPDQCGNIFNSTCTFKCHKGYCPYACNNTILNSSPWMKLPMEPRTCLENKKWSGVEFYCEKIKCPSLSYPKFGDHNCSGSDFGFDTVCQMKCDNGFILHGSETRQCEMNGQWTGKDTICKAMTCPPLKENKLLHVKPKLCHEIESIFDTVCQYSCKKGFKLVSVNNASETENVGVRKCLANGKWSRTDEIITCKDNSPPSLICPSDIQVDTNKNKPTAFIYWPLPKADDNVKVVELKVLLPPKLRKPPHPFNIGTTSITYIAIDRSGLNATCSFQIIIKDTEIPRVEYCPQNITKQYGERDGLAVTWREPIFIDNSGKTKIIVNTRNSGDKFYWDKPALVQYIASDPSGNNASCSFYVTIKQYSCEYAPPPLNGAVACESWLQGALCHVYCEEGYDFVAEPEDSYMCLQQKDSSKWGRLPSPGTRKPFKFPWPDCGKKQRPKRYTMKLKLRYYTGSCISEEATRKMQENFIKRLDDYQFISGLCPKESCVPENVVIKCGRETLPGSRNVIRRKKRNADNISGSRLEGWESQFDNLGVYMKETHISDFDDKQHRFKREEENSFIIEITWDVQKSKNETDELCDDCDDEREEDIMYKIKELQTLTEPELSKYVPDLSPIYENISFVLIPECDVGQVSRNKSCVNCPLGTFYSEDIAECLPCPVGKYQDNEASTFCKPCPHESSTVNQRSKSIEDCKKFCSPGSYSETGMETCQACAVATYQHLPAQKGCHKCGQGSTTWTIGSTSLANCTTMCPPGTYSDTGFHPCIPCPYGTYQPLTQGIQCIDCPDGLTTKLNGAHAPEYCQVVDFCKDLSPCKNGGTCTNNRNAYSCSCLSGFEGKNCEINIDDCSDDLCLNNGTCIDDINSYTCSCLAGFTGQICETNINDCHSESCFNGGTCIDGINKFVCKCPNGFTGDICEVNFYDCASNPCQNGGTCFDQAGDFRCCCLKGYTGKFCEQEIKECDTVDCYNGGTCINKLGGFECQCSEGFGGKLCENNIDDCQINSCENNGLCIDGISNYTCQCPPTFAGYHCETELSTNYGLKFPEPLTSNYVKLENKKPLSAVTVAFWMRTDNRDTANRGTPISYSFWNPHTRKEVDNALTLLDVNKFVFYLHGKEFHTDVVANSDTNWHHVAVTWESLSGNWLLYWDGNVRSRGSGVAIGGRLWSGYFVIGQEQDGIGLAFSTLESYKGEISQFNVWDHVLPSQSIQTLRNKCGLLGNVIAWTDVQEHLYGSVVSIENIDICSNLGECTNEDCYCVHATKQGHENCWRTIPSCEPNPCTGGQECITNYNDTSECKCQIGFEGIFCQYDVDECITNNGNCSHFCVNTHGSYHCSCPTGMRLAEDKYKCIDISFCDDNGLVYLNGETWTKKCEECRCNDGEISCTRLQCQKLECKENENEIFFPGECCSSCFEGYTSCTVHDENFRTFDDLEYSFTGNCRYSLMEDCFDGQFTIQYENLNPKSKEKTIFLYVHCLEINITVPGIVFIDGEEVGIPYRSSSLVHIIPVSENNSSTLLIYTTHGIIIKWESSGRIEIKAPPKYKRQICGLCGNFNGNKTDDFQTKQHLPARSVKDMGLSWKVSGYKYCRNETKEIPPNPVQITHYNTCKRSSLHMQQKAKKQCSVMKQYIFKPCYKHVNPRPYYILCLEDSCSCMHNEQCYCDSIMSYITECKRYKIRIKPQKFLAQCAMECTGGTVYNECGPACVETCRMNATVSACRNEVCVPGCHCPASMVLHNRRCIYKSQCPY